MGLLIPASRATAQPSAQPSAAPTGYAQALADQVRRVGQSVLPSVVTVEVVGVLQADGEVRQDAPTSGVIVDEAGHVLTSSLVTRGESASILVVLADGTRLPATVVASDEHRELVLLKVDAGDAVLTPASLAPGRDEEDRWRIGQTVVAVARYGESNQPLISTGILSAVDRLDGTAIQTDARVSPAFYGGPLMNLRGECLGILIPAVAEGGAEDATAWYDSGIAFAVPTDVIDAKLDRLKAGEVIRQGLLGLVVGGGDPYAPGTAVSAVRTRSPAEQAGLQVGDEIVAVGERHVRRQQEIKLALGRYDAGDEVAVRFRRDGREDTTTVTLVETIPPLTPQWLGIAVRLRSGAAAANTGPAQPGESNDDGPAEAPADPGGQAGMVIDTVVPQSPADGVLRHRDRLLSIDEVEVSDETSLRQRLWAAAPDQPLRITVQRREGDDAQESTQTIEVQPARWAGAVAPGLLQPSPAPVAAADWNALDVRLTDVTNPATVWFPKREVAATEAAVGLLVVLLPPAQRDVTAALEAWKPLAIESGVAVCLIASEADDRWRPTEIDAVSKLTAAAVKQAAARRDAVAIAGPTLFAAQPDAEAGPADSMVLAVALSTEQQFSGVAVSAQTRPPAVRLAKDGPLRLLRVLMPLSTDQEPPTWTATLSRLGYPLQTVPESSREVVLRWVNSLKVL